MVAEFVTPSRPTSVGTIGAYQTPAKVARTLPLTSAADTVSFSGQPAAAPQFGLGLKSWTKILMLSMLGMFGLTSCEKDDPIPPIENPTDNITTWDQALKSKTITTTQGANGTQSTLELMFNDKLMVMLPEGNYIMKMPHVTYENGIAETKIADVPVTVAKMGDAGLKITNPNGPITKNSIIDFGQAGLVEPRGSVERTFNVGNTTGAIDPADAWRYSNTPETMNKGIFGFEAFAEGATATNPDVSGFSDIAGAKAALPALLGLWGASASQIDALKAHLDDKTFQDVHSNVPQYMVATLINEVKHPGHLASMMGNNSQNAPLVNKTGTSNNSLAAVFMNGNQREIRYGKHAYKLPPQALALLQRTEIMENNGPAGALRDSKHEQVVQKLAMLAEYAQLLAKDPTVATNPAGYILSNNSESLALLNSGNKAIYQRLAGNLLGKGANDVTSAKSFYERVRLGYASTSDNETTVIPPEMKADLKALLGIEAGDVYTKALVDQIDAALVTKFDWPTIQTVLKYKPY
ncbi:MAG: hypothetical protein U0003_00110 [Vampirovibrionales bacterium]